ncbi:SAM-dependent methyltransferase [Nonomuraea typhae]|uniref:SAM-dependent methyltransferase n=1 Tax=Nonomuraea typhae TaxID=2603600 RepID=A0ABW7YNE7_9ACTN
MNNGTGSALNPAVPNAARIYDYFLGGKDNFPVDREAAEKLEQVLPWARCAVRDNRDYLERAVAVAALEYGVRQFIDIGSGLPTERNVHEVVQEIHPDAAVVYSDNDSVVASHARALLATQATVAFAAGDVRDIDGLLRQPEVTSLIDFEQPVAVVMVALLHFVLDEHHPEAILTTLSGRLPPGSVLAFSHACTAGIPAATVARATRIYDSASAPMRARSMEEIRALFGPEWVWQAPGLVFVRDWRPAADPALLPPSEMHFAGGIAVLKPAA